MRAIWSYAWAQIFILLNISTHNASFNAHFQEIIDYHKIFDCSLFEFVNNRATGTDDDNLRVALTIQIL